MKSIAKYGALVAVGFLTCRLAQTITPQKSRKGDVEDRMLDVTSVVNRTGDWQRGFTAADFEMDSNALGNWAWDANGQYVNEVLIVAASGGWDPTLELVQRGFTVWRRNSACGMQGCNAFDIEGLRKNSMEKRTLQSAWDYLGYLMDDSPERPEAAVIVFLPSLQLPEIDELVEMVLQAAECAKRTHRFVPLQFRDNTTIKINEFQSDIKFWNKNFARRPSDRVNLTEGISTYQGAHFAIPRKLLRRNPPAFYADFFNHIPTKSWEEGVSWKFLRNLFHVMFGEPAGKPFGYQGCKKPRNVNLLEKTALKTTVPRRTGKYMMRANAAGNWAWDPNGKYIDKILIVVGGSTSNPTAELVGMGFKVWRSNANCKRVYSSIITKDNLTKFAQDVCTESFGYLHYLSDSDESRPMADYIVFLHGHFESWHQPSDLPAVIMNAVQCATNTKRYTPLTMYDLNKYWHNDWEWEGRPQRWIKFWNENFGGYKRIVGKRLSGWACGSFVVPKEIILSTPVQFYQSLLEKKLYHGVHTPSLIDGFFFEYTFHIIFNEPEMIDTTKGIPQCPDFTYAETDINFIKAKKARYSKLDRIHEERRAAGGHTTKSYLPLQGDFPLP